MSQKRDKQIKRLVHQLAMLRKIPQGRATERWFFRQVKNWGWAAKGLGL